MKEKIGIWFAKSKNGQVLMFTSEPKKTDLGWTGNFYVNSIIYENLNNMLKNTQFSYNDDPQYIEFQLAEP